MFENKTLRTKSCHKIVSHHSALKHKSSPQELLCYCKTDCSAIIVRVITLTVSVINIFNF